MNERQVGRESDMVEGDVEGDAAPRQHGPGALGVIGYGLAALLATPVLTMLLGWVLYGHRSTWNVGQGDSFLVFIVAVFATPIAVVYWVMVGLIWRLLLPDVGGRSVNGVALVIYLIGLVVALVVTDAHYA